MTIHFFSFSDRRAPSARQRAFVVADELQKRGYTIQMKTPGVLSISQAPWPEKFFLLIELLHSLKSVKKGDVLFLHRTIYNKYFFVIIVCYLAIFSRKMIFDFDDPVYTHNALKTKVFCWFADAVMVSTHRQREWALQYNKNVYVVHIAINTDLYKPFTKDFLNPPEKPIIGWLGTGPEHLSNLPILASVLRRLCDNGEHEFTFKLIGAFGDKRVYDLFANIPGLDVVFIDTLVYLNPTSAPSEVQKFDIGVVPHRSDGEWNKGKTSMKVLEYMACAVPVVVSDFGEMPYIIQNGINGLVAATEEEWVENLTALLHNPLLRQELGKAGQKTVQTKYSFDASVPLIETVLDSLNVKKKNQS